MGLLNLLRWYVSTLKKLTRDAPDKIEKDVVQILVATIHLSELPVLVGHHLLGFRSWWVQGLFSPLSIPNTFEVPMRQDSKSGLLNPTFRCLRDIR